MSCSQCGAANPEGSRFCGRCGSALQADPAPTVLPGVGPVDVASLRQSAGGLLSGLVSVLTSVLGAVGLGMATDVLVKFVAARIAPFACGCLLLAALLAELLVCAITAGLLQVIQFK